MALFNSIMSTSELKCEDSWIIEMTDWDYGVECTREWTKSLELCYAKRRLPPKFASFPFFNDPDTEDQVQIKRDAAYSACQELMLIYDALIKKSPARENPKHRDMHQSICYNFCNALRQFHALTLHLKCSNFDECYKGYGLCVCPLGPLAHDWRHSKNLICLESTNVHDGQQACECALKSAQTYHSIFAHLQGLGTGLAKDRYSFHKGVHAYMKLCTKNLPAVAQYKLVMENSKPAIYHI